MTRRSAVKGSLGSIDSTHHMETYIQIMLCCQKISTCSRTLANKQRIVDEVQQRKIKRQQQKANQFQTKKAKAMDSIISEERLFDNKFIQDVKYMQVSGVIDSFFQQSSLLIGNKTMQSIMNKSQGSMFSKMTSTSKMIPKETLNKVEEDTDCIFSVEILKQRLNGIKVADHETTKKAVENIQRKLLQMKRKKISKQSKKEEQFKGKIL